MIAVSATVGVVALAGLGVGAYWVRRRRPASPPATREERVRAAQRSMRSVSRDSAKRRGQRPGNSWTDGDSSNTDSAGYWGSGLNE